MTMPDETTSRSAILSLPAKIRNVCCLPLTQAGGRSILGDDLSDEMTGGNRCVVW